MYPDKNVLYRSDNGNALSVVSKAYKIVQPKEVLEFYRDLVGVADMQLETAGVLFGGRRFFALANTGRLAELKGNDAVKGYLLLSTSCDGTLATSAQFTSVRVCCRNTLAIALKDGTNSIRVPHNRIWKPSEIKNQLGLIDSGWSKFKEHLELLTESPVEQEQGVEYLLKLFGDPDVPVDQQSPAVSNKCANIWQLFKGEGIGSTLESSNGTWFGLMNAVTETIDHHTAHKTLDARMNSSFFGSGKTKKLEAFELALELAA
jgi:phage/plasmid-like protein (TIGR03299 family)